MAKRKRSKGMGKRKGGAFEREVCKRMSKWITAGRHEDAFWRSAMSGGRATVARRRGVFLRVQEGDLSPIRKEAVDFCRFFSVECKALNDLKLPGMIYDAASGIAEIWHHLKMDFIKIPVLVAQQNFKEPIVMLTNKGVKMLRLNPHKSLAWFPHADARIYDFEYFLRYANFVPPRLRLAKA